jgi:hypothetical protein
LYALLINILLSDRRSISFLYASDFFGSDILDLILGPEILDFLDLDWSGVENADGNGDR